MTKPTPPVGPFDLIDNRKRDVEPTPTHEDKATVHYLHGKPVAAKVSKDPLAEAAGDLVSSLSIALEDYMRRSDDILARYIASGKEKT